MISLAYPFFVSCSLTFLNFNCHNKLLIYLFSFRPLVSWFILNKQNNTKHK